MNGVSCNRALLCCHFFETSIYNSRDFSLTAPKVSTLGRWVWAIESIIRAKIWGAVSFLRTRTSFDTSLHPRDKVAFDCRPHRTLFWLRLRQLHSVWQLHSRKTCDCVLVRQHSLQLPRPLLIVEVALKLIKVWGSASYIWYLSLSHKLWNVIGKSFSKETKVYVTTRCVWKSKRN